MKQTNRGCRLGFPKLCLLLALLGPQTPCPVADLDPEEPAFAKNEKVSQVCLQHPEEPEGPDLRVRRENCEE